MRAPSCRIASPTMYIDPVITTTVDGWQVVFAMLIAAATSIADSIVVEDREAASRISSGDAERGLSARVAMTRSAIGNRISAISPTALSRIAPNINISGRSGYAAESVDRKAHAPAGLCATSKTYSGPPVMDMTWKRPGQLVLLT